MQKDFIETPQKQDESFSTGNWTRANVLDYFPYRHFGFVKIGSQRLLFHDSCRLAPLVDRIRGTMNLRMTMEGRDCSRIQDRHSLDSIWLRLGEDGKIDGWFMPADHARGLSLLQSEHECLMHLYSQLPRFTVGTITGDEQPVLVIETNRPSTAIRTWDKLCQIRQTSATPYIPAAIVDVGYQTEVVFERPLLKSYYECLASPACIL